MNTCTGFLFFNEEDLAGLLIAWMERERWGVASVGGALRRVEGYRRATTSADPATASYTYFNNEELWQGHWGWGREWMLKQAWRNSETDWMWERVRVLGAWLRHLHGQRAWYGSGQDAATSMWHLMWVGGQGRRRWWDGTKGQIPKRWQEQV